MITKDIFLRDIKDKKKRKLLEEIFEEKENALKAYSKKDYEKVGNKTGKFVESVFVFLEYLRTGKIINKPKCFKIKEELKQSQRKSLPESVRIIIPRMTYPLYTLRNKCGFVHKDSEVSPSYINSTVCINVMKYIVSEIVRLYSEEDEDKVESWVKSIVDKDLPLVQEFKDGSLVVFNENLSCKEEILIIAYHNHPIGISQQRLREELEEDYKKPNVKVSLRRAINDKLIHLVEDNDEEDKQVILTLKGEKYVEDKVDKYLN